MLTNLDQMNIPRATINRHFWNKDGSSISIMSARCQSSGCIF